MSFILPAGVAAQDLVLGEFRSYSNIHTVGMEWNVTGDSDHDAVCTVSFRAEGETAWREALPLYRIDSNGYDMFGGSIFDLEPGTSYQIELSASDPDGGGDSRSLTIETRPVPAMPTGGPVYHVVPGSVSSGGDGSEANPFQGIAAADGHAAPGVTFLLHAGVYPETGDATYSGYTRFDEAGAAGNHVVWKAAGDGVVDFPGGCWVQADYVWLEGLTFTGPGEGGSYGLLTYGDVTGGVVLRNTFTGYYQTINLEHGSNFYVADNTIVGINDPTANDWSGEGIEGFQTSGHAIAHNVISRTGDGISVGGSNIDIWGNDIQSTSDDGIELDNCNVNVRVWRNRIQNFYAHAISFQPMDGAPWYVLRNQVIGNRALKLVDNPTLGRMLIAHNTFIGRGEHLVTFAHELASVQSNNNLWIELTSSYLWEAYGDDNQNWRTDLDYDGFYTHPDRTYPFYWGRVNYRSLTDFANGTGLQMHGIEVDPVTCFEGLDVPLEGVIPLQVTTLSPGSGAIDAGRTLPNVNDLFTGSGADLGAYEYGEPSPSFGPRAEEIELGPPGRPGQPIRFE